MSTTVRVRDEDKRRLDELQAKLTLARGQRVSLEDVIHRLVELAEADEDRVLGRDAPPRFTEEEKQEVLSMTFDLGVPTREEDIDETLYGGPEGPA